MVCDPCGCLLIRLLGNVRIRDCILVQIKVYNDRIYVIPKLFGISAPQESFFGRKGRIQARRDRRKGPSRIALVPTKTGVRQ